MRTLFQKVALAACFCLAMLGLASHAAVAQTSQSTWEQIQSTKKLRLGVAPTEPWYFKDTTGKEGPGAVKSGNAVWRGVGTMLAKEIADALGVELVIVETTWGNAVAGLQANQFDLMFMLDATPVRAMAIDFAGPVLWYPFGLIVKDELAGKTWAELNDPKYKLGGVTGSSTAAAMVRMAPNATVVYFPSHGELLAAFQSGRIDGAMSTAPTADLTRAKINMGKTLVPTPPVTTPTGAGIRIEPDARWRNYLNTVTQYLYNTGKSQEIYEQFLVFRGLDPKDVTPITAR